MWYHIKRDKHTRLKELLAAEQKVGAPNYHAAANILNEQPVTALLEILDHFIEQHGPSPQLGQVVEQLVNSNLTHHQNILWCQTWQRLLFGHYGVPDGATRFMIVNNVLETQHPWAQTLPPLNETAATTLLTAHNLHRRYLPIVANSTLTADAQYSLHERLQRAVRIQERLRIAGVLAAGGYQLDDNDILNATAGAVPCGHLLGLLKYLSERQQHIIVDAITSKTTKLCVSFNHQTEMSQYVTNRTLGTLLAVSRLPKWIQTSNDNDITWAMKNDDEPDKWMNAIQDIRRGGRENSHYLTLAYHNLNGLASWLLGGHTLNYPIADYYWKTIYRELNETEQLLFANLCTNHPGTLASAIGMVRACNDR